MIDLLAVGCFQADIGGPKNTLQFFWTSQMNARLFCGDPERKQHFSELVDVATVHAEQWQDTRIYALFRNEWWDLLQFIHLSKGGKDIVRFYLSKYAIIF